MSHSYLMLDNVSYTLLGRQRVGVIGNNGSGKSTLLKVMAQQLSPASGTCTLYVNSVYLDQKLSNVDADISALEHLRTANPQTTDHRPQKVNYACALPSWAWMPKKPLCPAVFSVVENA